MLMQDLDLRKGWLRDALQINTRSTHDQLHDHSHFVALFNGAIEHTQYRDLMIAFYGFYAPLECAIAQTPCDQDSFRYVQRTELLAQDLACLGLNSSEIAALPQCHWLEDIVTPASLGGVLYVIEGSTLGAAQIDRAAQKVLHDDGEGGRRFWAWSRANNKAQWTAINHYLEVLEIKGHPQDDVIKGAQDTFQALATWLGPLDNDRIFDAGIAS